MSGERSLGVTQSSEASDVSHGDGVHRQEDDDSDDDNDDYDGG